MAKKQKRNNRGIITVGGNLTLPGQKGPNVIVLTQPKRFGIDIADYMTAIRAAENVDYSRRYKLYDLYADILMDTHLTCVIEKRKNAVLCSDIEFRRDGKPDDAVNEQIRSPWFNRLVGDIIDAKFWGFSLCQFYREGEWVDYDLIPRKHVDPVRRIILRHQTDIVGLPWENYSDLLFIGSPDDLGLLAKAAPWVIYKRNTTGDWSQFSELFGMPIQEYVYNSDDEQSRQRAIEDAANIGSLAQFFHDEDTKLNFIEAGNKTGFGRCLRTPLRAVQQRDFQTRPRQYADDRILGKRHAGFGYCPQKGGGQSGRGRQAVSPRCAQLRHGRYFRPHGHRHLRR